MEKGAHGLPVALSLSTLDGSRGLASLIDHPDGTTTRRGRHMGLLEPKRIGSSNVAKSLRSCLEYGRIQMADLARERDRFDSKPRSIVAGSTCSRCRGGTRV